MKYIVVQVETNQLPGIKEYPIVFPDDITHLFMANAVTRALQLEFRTPHAKAISAGFVNSFTWIANGNSESLHLASRGQIDTDLIQHYYPGAGSKKESPNVG